MHLAVGGEKSGGDFALFAGPVEEDFLVMWGECVLDVRVSNVLVDATGREAEDKTFETGCSRRTTFVQQ